MAGRDRGFWLTADLVAYRNYLLHEYAQTRSNRTKIGLALATVAAHLSTIRGRYQALMQSNRLRDRLYVSLTPAEDSPADRKAVVDELLTRLQNAVHPTTAPGIDTLKGLRRSWRCFCVRASVRWNWLG